ncbi:MAG: hypothetical protein AB7I79_07320 [Rhizobiaceae bacterium]
MTRPAGPNARDRALRALAEGARPSLDLLADASGRSLQMMKRKAEREGWRIDRITDEDFAARIAVLASGLADRLEAAALKAIEEGGAIDKGELDGIISAIRGLEKIEEIMRPIMAAKDKKNDEDLADVLQKISDRIVALARDLADQMVEERDRRAQDGAPAGAVAQVWPPAAISGPRRA